MAAKGASRAASPGASRGASPAATGGASQEASQAATPGFVRLLTKEGLEHIVHHKYVAGKYTPLDNILNPWWYFLTNCCPLWLAPNLITFMGLFPLAACYCLQWWACPIGTESTPVWLLFLSAAALFFYQTLDAMDGKQARRTNSSTPLGQLFDHGCDCLATMSHHSQATAMLMAGGTRLSFGGMLILQTGFFLAQWEEYHTGILQTAAGPIGVTETQYGLIFGLAAGGLCGLAGLRQFMHTPTPILGNDWEMRHAIILVWCGFVGAMILSCLVRMAMKRGTLSVGTAIAQLFPVIALNTLAFCWNPQVLREMGRLINFTTGVHFFYLTTQLITFSMARQQYPALQRTIVPYAVLVFLSHMLPIGQVRFVVSCYAVGFFAFALYWVVCIVRQISGRLNISVFKIAKEKVCGMQDSPAKKTS